LAADRHNGLRIGAQVSARRAPLRACVRHRRHDRFLSPCLTAGRHRRQARQAVQAGERLAVIEAMKMENILTATQDATVSEILAKRGESLAVDQPILQFA
jgi:acetyl/propionyl-CoA carboxylase alpha subunit